mmetsp:Transcript_31778/g.84842  ORF Transcript_31778/g.84842 Transcript_31778/m.84842 type:complete len:205 (-) Transcript_31778:2885-3499(-)
MLCGALAVHCSLVSSDRDPSSLVFHGTTFKTKGPFHLARTFGDSKHLSNLEFPQNLATLNLQHVGQSNRCGAHKVLPNLGIDSVAVSHSEPTSNATHSLALRPHDLSELLFARTFQDLKNVTWSERAQLSGTIRELFLESHRSATNKVRLHSLLQKRRALIPFHAYPTFETVCKDSAANSGNADGLITPRAFKHFEHFTDLEHP